MSPQTNTEVKGTINHMKKRGYLWLIVFGFAAGIILLIIGSSGLSSTNEDESPQEPGGVGMHLTLEEYQEKLEQEIQELCLNVLGVSDVYVAVRLESGIEYIYAQDIEINSSGLTQSEYVIIGNSSDEGVVYVSEKLPQISGIGIVCKGGSNSAVNCELISLLSAAYDVPMNRIYVTEGH